MSTAKRLVFAGLRYGVVHLALMLTLYAQTGNVSGTVTDSSHNVLVGAQVQVEGRALNTASDDSGRYKILGVPVGQVKVTVSYLGLGSSAKDVNVVAGTTTALDFTLAPTGMREEVTVAVSPN